MTDDDVNKIFAAANDVYKMRADSGLVLEDWNGKTVQWLVKRA